ncbi:MAG TPA: hypothetical protein VF011_19050 [Terriglobales bacterium]
MLKMKIAGLAVLALGTLLGIALTSQATQPQVSDSAAAVKQVGAVKSVAGDVIVFAPDAGPEMKILVPASTRIVRIAPGEKDLKNSVPIGLKDLQAGDRILVRGKAGDAGQVIATGIIVMKLSDLEIKQQREREDWQKHGVAGLVNTVDGPTVTISVNSPTGKRTISVRTVKDTVVRRYAPDSVRFDDAKPGTLSEIKPGDQLRARGTRNPDGSELAAEEIVSGSFRNIAGTVASVDASSGAVTVLDLATKKPVVVRVTADSQLRNLPAEVAKRMAMRMVGAANAGAGAAPANGGSPNRAARPETMGQAAEGPGGASQQRGDIQQMFNRLPPLSVTEMQKGDTVMLVATQGSANEVTAIKLLDGVQALLAATPKNGAEAMTLSPWSLGSQGGEDANP